MTFDLEKARATYSAECAEDAANLVPDLIAEIERLRLLATFPKSESGLITGLCMAIRKTEEQAAEIERLRAKVGKMEFLMRSTEDTCLACAIKLEVIDQQAARIQELEEAHKRSGVKYAKIINELRSSIYANIPGLEEDKIEPEDAKPRSWQITDERKAALKRLYGLLVIRYKYSYPDETETLRAMLEEEG